MLARPCGGRFGVTAPSDPQQANGNGRKATLFRVPPAPQKDIPSGKPCGKPKPARVDMRKSRLY